MPYKDLEKRREYLSEYKAKHRDQVNLLERQGYERRKEGLLARRRRKYADNLEEYRIKFRAYAVTYRNKNRDKLRMMYKARRALLEGNSLGVAILEYIIQRDKGICQLCHRKVAKQEQSFDHIIPLSRGGHHIKENLQLTHLTCNQSKHTGRIPSQTRMLS